MDIQTYMDVSRMTRANYHLLLGNAIDVFSKLSPDMRVRFDDGCSPGQLYSYRGYYSDLSIEPLLDRHVTVGAFVGRLSDALDKTFTGYKGGDFIMGSDTPLWRAFYGSCGPAIVGYFINNDGLTLITRQID